MRRASSHREAIQEKDKVNWKGDC